MDYDDGVRVGIELVVNRMGGMALTNYARRCGIHRGDGEWDGHVKKRLIERLIKLEREA